MSKKNGSNPSNNGTAPKPKAPTIKEWTLMFYFASDNELASAVVSQLKALKDAGYHQEVNVLAHFDPHVLNTPTHIFDINIVNKVKYPSGSKHAFRANDPFVRNLVLDKLWGKREKNIRLITKAHAEGWKNGVRPPGSTAGVYDPPMPKRAMSEEQSAKKAFKQFLDFCREFYPARHYILIILGHGEIVNANVFMADDNSDDQPNSLSLKELGQVLRQFSRDVRKREQPGELEMVGFHSCSMNSLEVVYEIQRSAKYMLASQGPSFVGSWPYKQLLIQLFNDLRKGWKVDVEEMVRKMYSYCFYNNYDFQLAGYPFDIALADLTQVENTRAPITKLAKSLTAALKNKEAREAIQLAHLKAQSFSDENFVDLFDFCFCLREKCGDSKDPTLSDIADVTTNVMRTLRPQFEKKSHAKTNGNLNGNPNGQANGRMVLEAAFAGPAFQYSYGASIFFPWAEPIREKAWFDDYVKSELHEKTDWGTFLREYFRQTQRKTRADEHKLAGFASENNGFNSDLSTRLLSLLQNIGTNAPLHGELAKPGPDHPLGKFGPDDPMGAACTCAPLKNYPRIVGLTLRKKKGSRAKARAT
jgi:cysteine peptidase C11 family protein